MKKRLQRILSVLCMLALVLGCISFASSEGEKEIQIITVEWTDENDYDALRPASVSAKLGDQTVVLNEENDWTAQAAAAAGAEWDAPAPEGYTAAVRKTDVTVITYTHIVPKTAVSGIVAWNDNDNAAAIRPESVQLRLLADGAPCGAAVTVSAKNNWTAAWENLPVTQPGKTEKIVYSVDQAAPEGYAVSIQGLTASNTILTGGLTMQASVSGVPEGADVSGLSLTVTGPDPAMPVTLTLSQLSGGAYDFGQVLPGAYVLQDNNADTLVQGYVMDPENSKVGDAVVVKAGESAQLSFRYAYREPVPAEPNEEPLSQAGNLSITIDGPDPRMPMTISYADFSDGKYELDGLVPGTYYVIERNAETLVEAYTLTSDSVTGLSITVGKEGAVATLYNKYVPAPTPEPEAELTDIPVTKTWNDDNNKDGNRPESVHVRLYADGVEVDSHDITAAEGWIYTFTEKPVADEEGNAITYTISEDAVTWYVSTVNGYNVTNDYKPEVTAVTVSKVWDDNNDDQKLRPTSLAVVLQPVGTVYVLSEENGWTVTADNLPTKINGEDVNYFWTEQQVIAYVQDDPQVNGDVTVFTNHVTRVPELPPEYKKGKVPGGKFAIFEEYDTALGLETIINHVGDCFD